MSPVPNMIFVLGAGFSVEQGYPLVRHMRNEVIGFLSREQHSSYWGFIQPGDGGYEKGRFFDGIEKIDGNEQLQFEELLLKPCLSGYHPHPLYVVCLLGLQARAGAGALRRRSG